jgi:hypothetical protein
LFFYMAPFPSCPFVPLVVDGQPTDTTEAPFRLRSLVET